MAGTSTPPRSLESLPHKNQNGALRPLYHTIQHQAHLSFTFNDFPFAFRNFRVNSNHASHLASQLVTQRAYILRNAPLFLARLWLCAHLSLVSNLVLSTDSTQTTHEMRHTVSMGIASRCSRDTASLGIGKFDRPGTGSNSTPTMVERCYKPLPSVLYSHAPLSTSGTNFS